MFYNPISYESKVSYVLNNSELNNFLLCVISNIRPHNAEFREVLEVLYDTGLRSEEVINKNRWAVKSLDILEVKTCKYSSSREIKISSINQVFAHSIITGYDRYILVNYSSLNYFFSSAMMGKRFRVGGKRIFLHLFRYNFIRQLEQNGKTFNEIVAIMGHKEKANTYAYLTNKIIYE